MSSLALRVVESEARGYRRVWKGTVVTAFLNPILFLVAMGQGLGSLVDQGVQHGSTTLPYMDFIAPGLLAATAMQTASNEAMWPVMAGIKWVKTYHAKLATPIGVNDLVSGILIWIGIRSLMACVVFALVAGVAGVVPLGGMLLAVPAGVLTGLAFAAPLAAMTAVTHKESRLSTVLRFAIVPMFLFSGTFFPIEQLPGWLQPVALATPLWHGVDLTRSLALDVTARIPNLAHVAYLSVWVLAGWGLARIAFRKRLEV